MKIRTVAKPRPNMMVTAMDKKKRILIFFEFRASDFGFAARVDRAVRPLYG
jgi:hypothetical protein